MSGEFVGGLIIDLRNRLDELEAEKRAITRALRVLERRTSHGRRRDLSAQLIASIQTSPGSRASLLALELGINPSIVTTQLRTLEQNGLVVKRGLGWEVASSPEASPSSNVGRSR